MNFAAEHVAWIVRREFWIPGIPIAFTESPSRRQEQRESHVRRGPIQDPGVFPTGIARSAAAVRSM